MYQETRIPRLRAALWASTPDAPPSSAPAEVAENTEATMTAEVTPSAEVTGAVPPEPSLIVPDGCMDLIVIDSAVVIAGADSTVRIFRGSSATAVGLRFDPGVLPQLLATSASELADQVTAFEAVIGRRALGASSVPGPTNGFRPVAEPGLTADFGSEFDSDSATDSESAARRLLRIAETLTARVDIDHRPLELAKLLGTQRESRQPDIAEVAAEFAYSPRQLRRMSADWFGYGPKHLSKVLRWQAARALIEAGRTRTAAAAAAGYADAAHLWRDERSLLGR